MRRGLVLVAMLVTALAVAPAALAAPPLAPDLDPGSDSGSSATDNITTDSTPTFTVAGGSVGLFVVLCSAPTGSTATPTVEDSVLITNPAQTSGVTLDVTTPLTHGQWTMTARNASTPSCTDGEGSPSLPLDVDLVGPFLFIAPMLVDYVGSRPTYTFTSTPQFDVYAETAALVTLYEGTTAIGTGTSVSGIARVRVSTPLTEGAHTVYARATDLAGNVSANSDSATIIVDSTPASAGTPDLLDDDGESATDNYTSNPRPRFTVATEAGALVTLYRDGIALGAAAADTNGVATVRIVETQWLDPGLQCLYAVAMDALANAGPASVELCVTIAPGVPPFTSNLGVSLSAEYMALVFRPTVRAIAIIRVTRGGKLVAKTTRSLRAKTRTRIALRLPRTARGRLVVTATLRSTDARKLVLRRTVRR